MQISSLLSHLCLMIFKLTVTLRLIQSNGKQSGLSNLREK